ncbi:MAG: ubiquinone/menaquinone biosynthesis methyltransferase [Sphingobacteriia bacterium]|nr:ubiquinone/menaquinone biosynthesis methyltransferase [Sphingobacteriia bacterium]
MTHNPEKRPLLKMFKAVPPSYDLLNRILTLRMDEKWRKRAAVECLSGNPKEVLDLCTGTGDLALRLRKSATPATVVSALDYSPPMLERAKIKARKSGIEGINFIHGDVADLPFSENRFDVAGIAFAFRNLTFHNPDRDTFLKEILRVLKPGGRLVIVETCQPTNKLFRSLFHFYMKWITVPIGGIISGHYGAYRYLAHSASNYWNCHEASAFLSASGFSKVKAFPLLGGISAIYIAVK